MSFTLSMTVDFLRIDVQWLECVCFTPVTCCISVLSLANAWCRTTWAVNWYTIALHSFRVFCIVNMWHR